MPDTNGHKLKPWWTAAGIALAAVLIPAALMAQVGHRPGSSPYSDLRVSRMISLYGGYMLGQAGEAGVGPNDGPVFGARFEQSVSGPLDVLFGIGYARLNRTLIDPTVGVADRIVGQAEQSTFIVDGGLLLRLTGRKTWRGLVPYFGGSLGVAIGSSISADSLSGFRFGTHFQVGPQLGVHWYPANRLSFRAEGRIQFWRLSYPAVFLAPPENAPTEPPVLNPAINNNTDWTGHATLTFTLGYAIGF